MQLNSMQKEKNASMRAGRNESYRHLRHRHHRLAASKTVFNSANQSLNATEWAWFCVLSLLPISTAGGSVTNSILIGMYRHSPSPSSCVWSSIQIQMLNATLWVNNDCSIMKNDAFIFIYCRLCKKQHLIYSVDLNDVLFFLQDLVLKCTC